MERYACLLVAGALDRLQVRQMMGNGSCRYLELHHAVLLEAAEVGIDDLRVRVCIKSAYLMIPNLRHAAICRSLRTSSVFRTHCL